MERVYRAIDGINKATPDLDRILMIIKDASCEITNAKDI